MNLYNEIDDHCCDWLENLIRAKLIPEGVVDRRDIRDILPRELVRYRQCHFFAGLGGWPLALATAGVDPDRPLWTGSCPCQPFSAAGRQRGFADERHLWPSWYHLIAQCRPPTILGEQVASAAEWLRLVRGDLEAMDYAVGAIPIEAASAGADHLRDRFWFVADADLAGSQGRIVLPKRAGERIAGPNGVANADFTSQGDGWLQRGGEFGGAGGDQEACTVGDGERRGRETSSRSDALAGAPFSEGGAGHQSACSSGGSGEPVEWVAGADGKARRVKPGIRLLAHGVPARVAKLRAFGNAIDPRPAAEFIRAALNLP